MLQRINRQWILYPHKVRYTNNPTEINKTKWAVEGKTWWTETANKYERIKIHEFIDVDITEEMQQRYEEIKDMPEDFSDLYTEYVLNGTVELEDIELPTSHPFNIIRLKKKGESLSQKSSVALMGLTDLFEDKIETDTRLSNTMLALTDIYEELIDLKYGGSE